MSCEYTERYLEDKFEEGLEQGLTEEQAEKYAKKCLEEAPEPWWIQLLDYIAILFVILILLNYLEL